ncbi:YbjN domain-containing protein [Cyanobacteria bacterium FACHB-471]|nr:YbjN domain-containing protein [Cyanobacteria bacterium FACHB-471]
MQLTFLTPTTNSIPLGEITLSLCHQAEQLTECRLTWKSTSEQYQAIEAHSLFNLKPELRSTTTLEFSPDYPIEIQATLKPDRLPDLTPHATSAEATANYLLQLQQETPDHPLLNTENWLALTVKQAQESGEVGYTTLWATLNPAALAAGTISETEIAQALTGFFSDWSEANLGDLTEKTTAQILDEIGNFFNDLADTSIEAITQINIANDTILSQVIAFFTEDDWSFTKLKGQPVLRVAFQGDNGEWSCYAKVREEQQQFIFYSICPIATPEDKRQAIAEFLTRANYGMTIGNFELDFNDGEIRYKTSIDVEGDRLTFALIKRLVYTNVMMMDEYLPGIKAVIEEDTLPVKAIAAIEQIDTNPSSV